MSDNLARQFELLPGYLGEHVLLSVVSLAIGLAVSLPLGVFASRRLWARTLVLGAAGVVQTIPSLALLALMYPLLVFLISAFGLDLPALGFLPAATALVLYSMLPILRNTVAGLTGVEPSVVEAARAMGMTPARILLEVELPLASPVILAGIRTATVWVVGIATLATPIGQPCLGNYIFAGLDTLNWVAVLFGCVVAALLAVVLDQLIGLVEYGLRARRRGPTAVAAGLLAALLLGTLAPLTRATTRTRPLVVGSKNFSEQYILAELLSRRAGDAGRDVIVRRGLGSAVIFNALVAGEIDVYVDYSGTVALNHMKREAGGDRGEVLAAVTRWLEDTHGVRCLGALGFENTYALVMRRERSAELAVASVEDLRRHAHDMRLGGTTEFFGRPEWLDLRRAYGLDFAAEVSLNPTLMYQAAADGEVDVAAGFSTDGRIAAFDLAALAEPRGVLPPYDAVVLLSRRAAADGRLVEALRPLVGAVDADIMRQANMRVDMRGEPVRAAAAWLDDRLREAR